MTGDDMEENKVEEMDEGNRKKRGRMKRRLRNIGKNIQKQKVVGREVDQREE